MNSIDEPALLKAAHDLAEEIREGRWLHATQFQTKPAYECAEVIAEIRARCPGFERVRYEGVLATALVELRPTPTREIALRWFVAFTFVWAFLVVPPALKQFLHSGGSSWVGLLGYPVVCWIAAFVLLKRRWHGWLFFVPVNVLSGFTWIASIVWAVRAFARSFWR